MPPVLARRVFMLVTAGFAFSSFLLSALSAQLVPTLTALGLGGAALVVSTLFGPPRSWSASSTWWSASAGTRSPSPCSR